MESETHSSNDEEEEISHPNGPIDNSGTDKNVDTESEINLQTPSAEAREETNLEKAEENNNKQEYNGSTLTPEAPSEEEQKVTNLERAEEDKNEEEYIGETLTSGATENEPSVSNSDAAVTDRENVHSEVEPKYTEEALEKVEDKESYEEGQENRNHILDTSINVVDLDIPSPSPYVLQKQLEEVQRREEHFQSTAALKMLETIFGHAIENIHSANEIRAKGPALEEERIKHLSKKVDEYENRLKMIERHLRESQREKNYLLKKIDDLEKRVIEKYKEDLAQRITSSTVPSVNDLALLDMLNKHLREQEERSKTIGELEGRNRAMERVMNKADDLLLKSAWFKGGLISSPKEHEKKLRFEKYGRALSFKKEDAPDEIKLTSEYVTVIKDYKEESETSLLIVDQLLKKQEEAIPTSLTALKEEASEILLSDSSELSEGSDQTSNTSNEDEISDSHKTDN